MVRQRQVPATGWYVEIDHPSRDQPLTPQILDDPSGGSTINAQPRVQIPVPRDEAWQAEAFEDADMRVWEDGRRRPIETLRNVRMQPDQTVLVGVGAVELEERVQRSVDFGNATTIVEDMIAANTNYVTNIDDPQASVTEELIQEIDDATSWQATGSLPADSPVYVADDGTLRSHQTCWVFEAEEEFWSNFDENAAYSGKGATGIGQSTSTGDSISFSFETKYDIPSDDFSVEWRRDNIDETGDGVVEAPGFVVKLDGTVIFDASSGYDTEIVTLDWIGIGNGSGLSGPIEQGTHTLTLESTQDGDSSSDSINVDCIAAFDSRLSYNFDNDNGNPYTFSNVDSYATKYLDGPGLVGGGAEYVSDDISPALAVVGARLDTTWVDGDINGDQAVSLSIDSGSSWESESNSTSIERDYQNASLGVRWRVTFDGRGERTGQTPLKNHKSQAVDTLNLYADLDDTPTLSNRIFDNPLTDVLTTIAEEKSSLWEARWDSDAEAISIEWTRLGYRQSDANPDIADYQIDKSTENSVEKMTIYGASRRRRGEEFVANIGTAVQLDEGRLVTNSEVVRDPDTGEQLEPDSDYTVDPLSGTITALAEGDMTDGATYDIDYKYKLQGTYALDGVSDPREDVDDISGLGSDRVCEQAAYYIVQESSGPNWSGSITISREDLQWSVIDAINPDRLPTNGEFVQLSEVDTSTQDVVLTINSPGLSDVISRIRSRVSGLARQS